MTRNSPPKLGGEPARTAKREPERAKPKKKSQRGGWFPCRYWQLREPPRPRLRSGTPPNLGGEWPHTPIHSQLHRPLQRGARHHGTFCAKPHGCKMLHSLEGLKIHSTSKWF